MSEVPVNHEIFNELKNMVGEDFIGELIDTYLEDAPQLIETLRDSLETSDAEGFRRAAHSLKSNSASFGAESLAERAKELEYLGRDAKLHEVGDKLNALKKDYSAVKSYLSELRTQYD